MAKAVSTCTVNFGCWRAVEIVQIVTMSKVLLLDKLMSAIAELVLILLGGDGQVGLSNRRGWKTVRNVLARTKKGHLSRRSPQTTSNIEIRQQGYKSTKWRLCVNEYIGITFER
jgi:hypothetical protein